MMHKPDSKGSIEWLRCYIKWQYFTFESGIQKVEIDDSRFSIFLGTDYTVNAETK